MFHEEYICDELSYCLFLLNNSPNDKQLYPFTFHVRSFPNTEYERRDGIICRLDRDIYILITLLTLNFVITFGIFEKKYTLKDIQTISKVQIKTYLLQYELGLSVEISGSNFEESSDN